MERNENELSAMNGQTGGTHKVKANSESIHEKGKDSQHNRDINSKTVFGNSVLCAQFLRDNFDIPILRDVQPEDIEDVSERYHPYLGTEFDSDTVKKIRILDIEKGKKTGSNQPPFLVSLIEHKSFVDYDVSMQLLRYMVCIWTEYRREREAVKEGCSGRKGFRYPVIIPIVYYEGRSEWTADIRLGSRIGGSDRRDVFQGFQKWIPDFQYNVVRIHDYSDNELLERGDEMSLIMLVNKIQDTADLEHFIRIPPDRLNRIIRDSPEQVVDILAWVMESLCFKIEAPAEDRIQCVRKVRERKMGYLFENMQKISITEQRQKVEEEKKKVEEEKQKVEEQKQKVEEQKQKVEEERQKVEEEKQKVEEERQKAEEKLRLAEEMIKRLQEERSGEK